MRNRPKRRLSWYIIWYSILFFIIVSIIAFTVSLPVWRIKRIKVLGLGMISRSYVEKPAEYLLGENLFLADYGPLAAKIAAINQVEDFGIWRRLPSTVVVRIVERKPFAIIITSGLSYVVDDDGFVINVEGGKSNTSKYPFIKLGNISGLPVVKGVSPKKIVKDKLADDVSSSIRIAITELSRFLKSSNLQLELKGEDNVNLLVEDVLRVRFGSMENISKKVSALESLLPKIDSAWSDVEYVDIRAAGSPVVKYKKGKRT